MSGNPEPHALYINIPMLPLWLLYAAALLGALLFGCWVLTTTTVRNMRTVRTAMLGEECNECCWVHHQGHIDGRIDTPYPPKSSVCALYLSI